MPGKAHAVAGSGVPQHGAIAFVGELASVAAVPWKNEGGQTRELCVEPPEADFASFIWRASVADFGSDADFSTFEGIDRTIVLLEAAVSRCTARDGRSTIWRTALRPTTSPVSNRSRCGCMVRPRWTST